MFKRAVFWCRIEAEAGDASARVCGGRTGRRCRGQPVARPQKGGQGGEERAGEPFYQLAGLRCSRHHRLLTSFLGGLGCVSHTYGAVTQRRVQAGAGAASSQEFDFDEAFSGEAEADSGMAVDGDDGFGYEDSDDDM